MVIHYFSERSEKKLNIYQFFKSNIDIKTTYKEYFDDYWKISSNKWIYIVKIYITIWQMVILTINIRIILAVLTM